MDNFTTLKTKDADEAAFFWTMDDKFSLSNIETIEQYNRQLVWFYFTTSLSESDVEQIRKEYNRGLCSVEPRKYSYRRREIRRIILQKQNSN